MFDEVRSTNRKTRKEERVTMSMLCFAIDSAIQNAFSIYRALDIKGQLSSVRGFKRIIPQKHVTSYMEMTIKNKNRAELN